METKTNEQMLISFIKDNSPIINAILVERLSIIIKATADLLEKDPSTFNTFFSNAEMYKELVNNFYKNFPNMQNKG